MIEADSPAFWRATLALCLGSFMIFCNLYVTQPLLPLLSAEFGVSPLLAGLSFSLTTLTLGGSLLLYGPLSDALGRKWIMVATMAAVTLITLLLSCVTSFEALLALRVLQGVFLGGLPAIAIAYMGDEFNKKALLLAVGLYISGNSLGGISGRLIGGFVADLYGRPAVFLVLAALSLLCLLVFARLLPSSRHFERKPLRVRAVASDLRAHLGNPRLLPAYLIGGLNFLIFVNQYSYITFVLSEQPYALSPSLLGLLFLTYLSGTVGSALSGRMAQRWSQPLCMGAGILILMLGSLVTLLPNIWLILLGLLINSFGFFLCHSLASSWVSHNARFAKASASSLYLVFYYVGASIGGFYLEPFWRWAGWTGVVAASLPVLLLTFGCALWLLGLARAEAGKAWSAGQAAH